MVDVKKIMASIKLSTVGGIHINLLWIASFIYFNYFFAFKLR